jgi:outer membrane protein TolC
MRMRRTGWTTATLGLLGVAWLSATAAAQTPLTADRAVEMALEYNSEVINAEAGVYDAKSGLYSAYSGILPHVSAGVSRGISLTTNQTGVQIFGGSFAIESNTLRYESYQTSPTLSGSWNVFNLSSLKGWSSARSGLRSARLTRQAARNEVALAARSQFYEVVKAIKLAGVSREALRLARDNERRVQALFDVGSVSRSDVLRQQVQTHQAVLDSIVSEQNVLVQRVSLATFIGVEEARMGEVDTVLTVTPRDYDEAALYAEAAANRPDLKAAAAQLSSARANVWSARLMRLPYLSVSGSATFRPKANSYSRALGVDPVTGIAELTEQTGNNQAHRYVSARVSLNWDLIDGLLTDSRNAQAKAQMMRAQDAYDVLRRNLESEVHEAFITYQQTLAGEEAARAAVASAQENVKLVQEKYNVGSATILDLIDAQVQLSRAESQEVSALATIRVAEAQIERVRGHHE